MSSPIVYNDDVQLLKNFPSFEYNPATTETDGIYHEDREISGLMYRATNATYNDEFETWSQPNGAQSSYALVQNTDGSISYLYMPPQGTDTWTTWLSADVQEFYAVNYGQGFVPNDMTAAANNTAALQAAIAAALANGNMNTGGIVRLPAGLFYLEGPILTDFASYLHATGLVIAGFSAATQLVQTLVTADIFTISYADSGFGVVIKDMKLQYASGNPGTSGSQAAVNLSYCQNVTCERVYFADCPTSFQTDVHCLQCGLFECTINYDLKTGGEAPSPVSGQTMVYLNGSNDFVTGCIIAQQAVSSNGPTDCTGISIGDNNAQRYITDCHLSDFQTCLTISVNTSVVGVYCVNTGFYAYGNAVVIEPAGGVGTVNDVHFNGCKFTVSGVADYEGQHPWFQPWMRPLAPIV